MAFFSLNILSFTLLILIAYRVLLFYKRVQEYPPGPIPLPIVGNFVHIDTSNPHRKLIEWSKKYGDVYTVWLPKPVVVLSTMKSIQEALLQNGDHFAGRPMSYLYTMFTGSQKDGDGIILCQGPKWQAQRRFALRTFRTLGMGKRQMEERIFIHLRVLMQRISRAAQERGGENVSTDLRHSLALCFGNIIHDLVMGRSYKENDEEFIKFKKMLDNMLEGVASVQMLLIDSFPLLRFFLPSHKKYLREGFALQKFFLDEIREHERSINEVKEPSNFIDCYLKDLEDEEHSYLTMTLAINSGDLWTGGLETVVTTILWGIIFMVHSPDIQHKVQNEIDEKIGRTPLELVHRQQTPYLHATIDELQRIVNVLPWNIPHSVSRDTVICGRKIKAGVTIMPQIGCIHFDGHLFPNPEQFDPSRFIDDNGSYRSSSNFIPFGIGKRACLGESLARMELYLVFGSLLQNFTFKVDPRAGLPCLKRSPGMTSVPKPASYIIEQRFDSLIC